MKEKALWAWLKAGVAKPGISHMFMIQRVENVVGGKGVPDVECSAGRGGFWIELKRATPSAGRITVNLSPAQCRWLMRRWALDHGSWVLVQVNEKRYLFEGSFASLLAKGVSIEDFIALACIASNTAADIMLQYMSNRLREKLENEQTD